MPPTRRSGRPAPAPAALRPRRTPAPRRLLGLCLALGRPLGLTLCLVLCLALAAPVRAAGQDPAPASAPPRPYAVVATLSDFPPYCAFIPGASPQIAEPVPVGADSTQLRGFAWEVVRDALHAAGVDIELKVAPWARTLHYLDSGQADLAFPAMHTQQRDQTYLFSREAVVRSTLRMYVRADAPQVWTGLAAWSGREVAVIQGWAYGPHWDQHTGIIPHPVFSVQQGFAMLDKGRVAGVAGYEVPFDLLLR
ncbi:MAG: substrate-binding periplasmic protein, partial [Desulfovibrionaceae bacterium]